MRGSRRVRVGAAPGTEQATAGSTTPTTTAHASTPPTATAGAPVSPNTATSTPACVGLSICSPQPDAEGNPACYYSDDWAAGASGSAIDVYYFHEPRNLSKPDDVTAEIRMKDGTVASQIAPIDAGQHSSIRIPLDRQIGRPRGVSDQ